MVFMIGYLSLIFLVLVLLLGLFSSIVGLLFDVEGFVSFGIGVLNIVDIGLLVELLKEVIIFFLYDFITLRISFKLILKYVLNMFFRLFFEM